MASCPVCGHDGCTVNNYKGGEFPGFQCPRCAEFYMTDSVLADSRLPLNDHQLSAWIRNENEYGRAPPEFTTHNLPDISENLPPHRPSEKHHILLQAVERRTEFPGFTVTIDQKNDYPLCWASSKKELTYFVKSLVNRNLLTFHGRDTTPRFYVQITADGWDALDDLQSSATLKHQAFVAMSFSDDMEVAWEEGIRPAIEEAGYSSLRVDKVEHADRIDAKIIADIRESRFIVADVTQQKQGVYFETGYAIGLGRPVIWTVHSDDLDNVHFDTRQYNHIVWNDPADLRDQLYNRIRAVIG